MTLDPEFDAKEQRIRQALEDLRQAVGDYEGKFPPRHSSLSSYESGVGYLIHVFAEDRREFFEHVNSGFVWRNMGSLEDFGDRRIDECLVQLASALDAAGLANATTLEDAAMLKERLDGSRPTG